MDISRNKFNDPHTHTQRYCGQQQRQRLIFVPKYFIDSIDCCWPSSYRCLIVLYMQESILRLIYSILFCFAVFELKWTKKSPCFCFFFVEFCCQSFCVLFCRWKFPNFWSKITSSKVFFVYFNIFFCFITGRYYNLMLTTMLMMRLMMLNTHKKTHAEINR